VLLMRFDAVVVEVSLEDDLAYVELPDGTRKRVALSLREHLEASGGAWEFTLPTPVPGSDSRTRAVPVSLRRFEARDIDSTYVLVQTRAKVSLEEAMALDLRDTGG
jgi:hypothetical protein